MQVPVRATIKRNGQSIRVILGTLERTEAGLTLYSLEDGMESGDTCEISGEDYTCVDWLADSAVDAPAIYHYFLTSL